MNDQEWSSEEFEEFKKMMEAYRAERWAHWQPGFGGVRPADPCAKKWKDICPQVAHWIRETSRFDRQVYDFLKDEFGFPGGVIDPPPDPPF